MSNEPSEKKPETARILEELGRSNRSKSRSKSGAGAGVWLLTVLVVALASGGGWFAYEQWQIQQSYEQTFTQLRDDNERLRAEIADAQTRMADDARSQLTQLQQSEQALTEAMSSLEASAQRDEQRFNRLQQQIGRDMQDVTQLVDALQGQVANLQQRDVRWLNAEADYLMRLAERKLTLEADVASAVMLLETIDALLAQQDSLLADTARQNISQDIQRLQNLRLPNRVALAEQLIALGEQLQQVSFSATQQQQAAYQDGVQQAWSGVGADATVDTGWWSAMLDLLRTVFVWREIDQGQPALLQPDQAQLLTQQLMLQIEQARLAVVQSDEQMFDLALSQLSATLSRFGGENSTQVQNLRARIETLQQSSLTAELPDLSASASLLRQLASRSAADAARPNPPQEPARGDQP